MPGQACSSDYASQPRMAGDRKSFRPATAVQTSSAKPVWSLVVDYTLFPLVALPVCCVYLAVARVLSMLVPFLILPTYLIARPFYWAVPLARAAFDSQHPFYVRWGFETTYAMNIIRRFLTLPLRRSVPDVYILGFPKCGTTALAQYLMQHPAISGIDGLPYDPALSKESHFATQPPRDSRVHVPSGDT